MSRKITVITGDNTDLINKGYRSLIDKKELTFENTIYIDYPESKKHPKIYCSELRNNIKEESRDFVILTFSNELINLFGHMIYKKEITKEEIKLVIFTKESRIDSNYDEEGYLENYPFDYLGWDEEY